MTEIQCPICGRTRSLSQKAFTDKSLKDHIRECAKVKQCPKCGRARSRSHRPFTDENLKDHLRQCNGNPVGKKHPSMFPMTDMVANEDTPDGAYFALAWELGEL